MTREDYKIRIPNYDWKYQFSIHLKPTSNAYERLFVSKWYSTNHTKDKRNKIDYLQKHYSPVIKDYILDYLNPNRSSSLFFPLFIQYERDNKDEPYHLHLAMGEPDNKCFFINKRARLYFKRNDITSPNDLSEDLKISFLEYLIRKIRFRESEHLELKKITFNSKRAVDIREKDSASISHYLSKYKNNERYDPDYDLGCDWKNSILITKDLRG